MSQSVAPLFAIAICLKNRSVLLRIGKGDARALIDRRVIVFHKIRSLACSPAFSLCAGTNNSPSWVLVRRSTLRVIAMSVTSRVGKCWKVVEGVEVVTVESKRPEACRARGQCQMGRRRRGAKYD